MCGAAPLSCYTDFPQKCTFIALLEPFISLHLFDKSLQPWTNRSGARSTCDECVSSRARSVGTSEFREKTCTTNSMHLPQLVQQVSDTEKERTSLKGGDRKSDHHHRKSHRSGHETMCFSMSGTWPGDEIFGVVVGLSGYAKGELAGAHSSSLMSVHLGLPPMSRHVVQR